MVWRLGWLLALGSCGTSAPDFAASPGGGEGLGDATGDENRANADVEPVYDGCRSHYYEDQDGADQPETQEHTTYSDDGLPTHIETDDDGNTRADVIQDLAYDGELLLVTWDLDTDADGVADERYSFGYDAAGLLEVRHGDTDGDLVVDQRRTHSYDEEGRLLGYETDDGLDGVADEVVVYERSVDGRTVVATFDDDGDGAVDRTKTWTYGEAGRLEALVSEEGDYTYRYGATTSDGGRVLAYDMDVEFRGAFYYYGLLEYFYGRSGRPSDIRAAYSGSFGDLLFVGTYAWECPL